MICKYVCNPNVLAQGKSYTVTNKLKAWAPDLVCLVLVLACLITA